MYLYGLVHSQKIKDNWMEMCFMVFDNSPCNNREVPLYFLKKLLAEFMLGHHVNYFDIGEFHMVARGSSRDRENAR
jgi:hypothetical protein